MEMNERQSETRTGSNIRDDRKLPPRVWAIPDNPDPSPIEAYMKVISVRPADFSKPLDGQMCFKRQQVGHNKLGSWNMLEEHGYGSNFVSDKGSINHSGRKHLNNKC